MMEAALGFAPLVILSRILSEASIMMRLPRLLILLTLACCLAVGICVGSVLADDATPAAPPPDTGTAVAAPPTDTTTATAAAPALNDLVDDYWHYGKIARYDLASDAGEKIVAADSGNPRVVLEAFEAVAGAKGDVIDKWMLRWKTLPVPTDPTEAASAKRMRDVSTKLNDLINQGYETRRSDPDFIRNTINEMASGSRAYDNNLPRLAKSGELAVKVLIDILRNPDERQYHSVARRILRDLGRKALNPLLAATEMKDYDTLVDVIAALGDIGYSVSTPYLSHLATGSEFPSSVHTAAHNALTHMGASSSARPADQFYDEGEKFYYSRSDIEPSGDKTAFIWFWNPQRGLTKRDVPTPIFGDCMAMRECEYALKLDPGKGEAVGLWLASNTRREAVDMPTGGDDPTHRGIPDAHYYNVSAGVQYVNNALARALHDHNAPLSFQLTSALRDIIGQGNIAGSAGEAVQEALYFPNRLVRYEAALALAESMPTQAFPGSDRVVPLLVEAMTQNSKPNILIVAPTQDDTLNTLRTAVQSLEYTTAGGSTPNEAAAAANTLPAVDIIIISEDSDVRRMVDLEQTIAHLQGASMLVLTHAAGGPYADRSATDPLMNAAMFPPKASLSVVLKDEIEKARQHAGAMSLTDEQATHYALRSAELLEMIAISHSPAMDVAVAEPGLLTSLGDPRAPVAEAAGRVLSLLNSPGAQNGLATRAIDASTPAEVRISLFNSLARSAKFFGNRLDGEKVTALEKVVSDEKDPQVRGAAASARGALNLPADQARQLILAQSHV